MNENFKDNLLAAKNKEEFLQIINDAETEKFEEQVETKVEDIKKWY